MAEQDDKLRRLQYRLKRQGMLELDAWLLPLQKALQASDDKVILEIEKLLTREPIELLAMQTGKKEIPKELQPWLNI